MISLRSSFLDLLHIWVYVDDTIHFTLSIVDSCPLLILSHFIYPFSPFSSHYHRTKRKECEEHDRFDIQPFATHHPHKQITQPLVSLFFLYYVSSTLLFLLYIKHFIVFSVVFVIRTNDHPQSPNIWFVSLFIVFCSPRAGSKNRKRNSNK
jgi:hypothetical protein